MCERLKVRLFVSGLFFSFYFVLTVTTRVLPDCQSRSILSRRRKISQWFYELSVLKKAVLWFLFFPEKRTDISVFTLGVLLFLGFWDGTAIDSCSLFMCKYSYSKMKWLGIISYRLLFLKEQWLVLVGYFGSLKEIVFPWEKKRQVQHNLLFCLSFFTVLQEKTS